jgi:cell wall-associated NlpC family hydrolase
MPAEHISGSGDYSFDSFFNAIAQQESGGNYGAVNSRTGASGKFQIMPANIGPWSQQYLGRRISVGQFRSSPQLQEQLARAVLQDYYSKWGARGAASAWYSGSPNKADNYHVFRSGEPSVGAYVDQVLGRVGPGSAPLAPTGAGISPIVADPIAPLNSGVDSISASPDSLGRVFQQAAPAAQQASSVPGMGGAGFTAGAQGSDPKRDKMISFAMSLIGTPYKWGGTSAKGIDCSGLVQLALKQIGISAPRISAAQANMGRRTSIDQLRPGDLVALDNSSRNSGADHIAIYLGNNEIIEAPHAGASVRVRTIGAHEGFWGVSLDI